MKTRARTVAGLLLAVILAGPAMAITGCGMEAQVGSVPGAPHCLMMAKMAETAPAGLRALPANASCCRVVPARPEPVSYVTAPSDSDAIANTAAENSTALPVQVSAVRSDSSPPLQIAPSQAVLCTFLI